MMTAPSRPIYLDYASTTPVHPRVRQAMEPYFQQEFGNPSSLSPLGRRAAEGCERARAQIARVLACHDDEVVFTSGGSASDNVALKGVALARPGRRHLVTTTVEHSAVLGAARGLHGHFGVEVTHVPVAHRGIGAPAAVAAGNRAGPLPWSVLLPH